MREVRFATALRRATSALAITLCATLLLSGCSLNGKGREMDELLNSLELEELFGEPSHQESKVYQFSPEGYTTLAFEGGEPDDYLLAIKRAEEIGSECSRSTSGSLGTNMKTFVCQYENLEFVIYSEESIERLLTERGGLPGFYNIEPDDDFTGTTLLFRIT